MITGHATGTAAAMAAKQGTSVQGVDVAGLQAVLSKQGQVIEAEP